MNCMTDIRIVIIQIFIPPLGKMGSLLNKEAQNDI